MGLVPTPKYALSTAGAAMQIVGWRQRHPKKLPLGMMLHPTFGVSLIRVELWVSKLVCSMRP